MQIQEKIKILIDKGVKIPNERWVDIGEEVDLDRIGSGVTINPGSRIYGSKTTICSGTILGSEGPVTVENCQIGSRVELKGGYFRDSVFLDGVSMGYGSHVREACILEEESSTAHCVGLKHTILFPFVTLGSLINFCDCLMAGGTSRKNHGEVGSSFIHFNFTPYGDKATATLIGDVPGGVMLDKPPVFLGGQGGIVGPLRLGFGNVVAAGSILRGDFTDEGKLICEKVPARKVRSASFEKEKRVGVERVVTNNLFYIANLLSLKEWYLQVRRIFFADREFGKYLLDGAIEKIKMAIGERLKRLGELERAVPSGKYSEGIRDGYKKLEDFYGLYEMKTTDKTSTEFREKFLEELNKFKKESNYIETIKSLPSDVKKSGTMWLDEVVKNFMNETTRFFPFIISRNVD